MFSDLDFLGWYTTGDSPTEQDIQIHKQICNINECPIMLQLNPQSRNVDVCLMVCCIKYTIMMIF